MEPISVNVEYWTVPDGSPTGIELQGTNEFRNELQKNFTSLVRAKSGACGGGLYELIIKITSSISLTEIVSAIKSGVIYDCVKVGANSFFINPLSKAIENLRQKSSDRFIDVDEITFSFQDADVYVKRVSKEPIFDQMGNIFKALADNFSFLKGKTGEAPYAIHIPIFEDPDPQICRFRGILDVDETIQNVKAESYVKFWGVRYNLEGKIRVFDVGRRLLIDESYMTQEEYWNAWQKEWDKKNIIKEIERVNEKK